MWCSTECWDCEDKTCEHYRSKLDLYFENKELKQNINKVINDINRYLDARKIINDNTKYYYTNEFYKKPIKSNIAYLFNDYLEYLLNILQGINEGE